MDGRAAGAAAAKRRAEAGGALSRASTAPTRCGRGGKYYESIDLIDAFHPQTILAYDMNGAALAVPTARRSACASSASSATSTPSTCMRIEAVSSFAMIRGGRGGFWEDRGYEWYAGI